MEREKTFLLNGRTFEQLLARAWRELEKKNLREAAWTSLPPKKIRSAGKVLQKRPAPRTPVRSTAT